MWNGSGYRYTNGFTNGTTNTIALLVSQTSMPIQLSTLSAISNPFWWEHWSLVLTCTLELFFVGRWWEVWRLTMLTVGMSSHGVRSEWFHSELMLHIIATIIPKTWVIIRPSWLYGIRFSTLIKITMRIWLKWANRRRSRLSRIEIIISFYPIFKILYFKCVIHWWF